MNKTEKELQIKELLKSQDFNRYLHSKKINKFELDQRQNSIISKKFYRPKTKEELKKLILNPNIKLSDIITDEIVDMSWLFHNSNRDFSGIESWNVSRVEDMNSMFSGCISFNAPIGNWNVQKVTNMSFMFKDCKKFNQDLQNWSVNRVKDMSWMFANCLSFNQDLQNWSVSMVKNMSNMFYNCVNFNQNLGNWSVENTVDFSWMFKNCINFNQDISKWKVIKSDNIDEIFKNCLNLEKRFIYYFLQNINENTKTLLTKDEFGNFVPKTKKEFDFLIKLGAKLEQIDQSKLENFHFNFKTYETDDFKISELNFGKKLIIAQIKTPNERLIDAQIINNKKLLKN